MQTQQQRDEKTLVITTALGLFVLMLAIGSVLLWTIDSVFDWRGQVTNALFWTLVAVAASAAVAFVARGGRS